MDQDAHLAQAAGAVVLAMGVHVHPEAGRARRAGGIPLLPVPGELRAPGFAQAQGIVRSRSREAKTSAGAGGRADPGQQFARVTCLSHLDTQSPQPPPRPVFQTLDRCAAAPYSTGEYARRILWNMVQA